MTQDTKILDDRALDVLFRQARTFNGWQKKDVTDVMLQAVFDLMKWGPTSANCSPARFAFIRTAAAKEKLKPHLMEGNVAKTMAAPVTVIIAHDMQFYDQLPKLFPHTDARSWFAGNQSLIEDTAFRNGSLQGAYFMLAARAIGLDCGPMSGFDKKAVKDAFFADQNVQVNFLCNIGYGDTASLHPRSPRFAFDDICKVL